VGVAKARVRVLSRRVGWHFEGCCTPGIDYGAGTHDWAIAVLASIESSVQRHEMLVLPPPFYPARVPTTITGPRR
jgi:hypothetical protein